MISNLGNAILVSAPPNPVHISYRWRRDDETIEGLRSLLPGPLTPGSEVPCRQVAWFDDLDEGNAYSAAVRIA